LLKIWSQYRQAENFRGTPFSGSANNRKSWNANPRDAKVTIPAGPNDSVRLVWIDISKEHYGLRGTPVKPGTRVLFEK
jgi:hypothetical protein